MIAPRMFPSRCRCGASGFLETVPQDAGDSANKSPSWQFIREPDAAPVSPPKREQRVAIHEAGHAVMMHAIGRPIASVTIDEQPHVAAADRPTDHFASTQVALAGDHAERLILHQHEYRPLDAQVRDSFAAVRDLRGGGCDRCQAALACFGLCGSTASDNVLLTAYRAAEAATIATLRELPVKAAIRRLSEALLVIGTIQAPHVHEIIETAGVEFGSRREAERKHHA